jgi:hypothetical protein
LPDDPDIPPDDRAHRRDDQAGAGRQGGSGNGQAETRDRQEYYAELRVAASKEESVVTQRVTAAEQAATSKWQETAAESRWMWTEYQRRWPPEERPAADRSSDPPGSWRGLLNRADNGRVEAACDQIADREEQQISPALRALEGQDSDRHLIGFEDRLKDRDRIKEKVHDGFKFLNRSPEDAVALVSDAIRYTFQYRETHYTQGVWSDIGRLRDQGFKLDRLRNSWSDEQYKGINSQWIEPGTGQRFEIQFHTRISYEAKQLTHKAYERLRTKQADAFEELVLEAFQKKVAGEVPVPPGGQRLKPSLKKPAPAFQWV